MALSFESVIFVSNPEAEGRPDQLKKPNKIINPKNKVIAKHKVLLNFPDARMSTIPTGKNTINIKMVNQIDLYNFSLNRSW